MVLNISYHVSGLDDIISDMSVGVSRKFLISKLTMPLQHGQSYYITVKAINSAGLQTEGTCNITVELLPPDVRNLSVNSMFSQTEDESFDISMSPKEIGLEWGGGSSDIEFYGILLYYCYPWDNILIVNPCYIRQY